MTFAAHGLVDEEYTLPTEQRLALSVAQPQHPVAMSPKQVTAVSKARISYGLMQLAQGMHEEVATWLRDIAKTSPKDAVLLYLELVQFSIPKIKAVAVQVDDRRSGENLKDYSVEELQRIANGGE